MPLRVRRVRRAELKSKIVISLDDGEKTEAILNRNDAEGLRAGLGLVETASGRRASIESIVELDHELDEDDEATAGEEAEEARRAQRSRSVLMVGGAVDVGELRMRQEDRLVALRQFQIDEGSSDGQLGAEAEEARREQRSRSVFKGEGGAVDVTELRHRSEDRAAALNAFQDDGALDDDAEGAARAEAEEAHLAQRSRSVLREDDGTVDVTELRYRNEDRATALEAFQDDSALDEQHEGDVGAGKLRGRSEGIRLLGEGGGGAADEVVVRISVTGGCLAAVRIGPLFDIEDKGEEKEEKEVGEEEGEEGGGGGGDDGEPEPDAPPDAEQLELHEQFLEEQRARKAQYEATQKVQAVAKGKAARAEVEARLEAKKAEIAAASPPPQEPAATPAPEEAPVDALEEAPPPAEAPAEVEPVAEEHEQEGVAGPE